MTWDDDVITHDPLYMLLVPLMMSSLVTKSPRVKTLCTFILAEEFLCILQRTRFQSCYISGNGWT